MSLRSLSVRPKGMCEDGYILTDGSVGMGANRLEVVGAAYEAGVAAKASQTSLNAVGKR